MGRIAAVKPRSFGTTVSFIMKFSGMSTISLRQVVVVLSMAMLATACGGDTGSSESVSDVNVVASGEEVGSAASARAFCDVAREADVRAGSFNPFGAEAADVEAFFTNQFALYEEGIATAPRGDIKADIELLQSSHFEMMSLLEAADWDYFAVDFDAMDELSDGPELNAAGDRIDAHLQAECGIQPDDDKGSDDDEGFDGENGDFEGSPELLKEMLESPAMRAMLIEDMMSDSGTTEDQASCFLDSIVELGLFSAMDNEDPDTTDLIAMLEVFDRCGIDPNTFN